VGYSTKFLWNDTDLAYYAMSTDDSVTSLANNTSVASLKKLSELGFVPPNGNDVHFAVGEAINDNYGLPWYYWSNPYQPYNFSLIHPSSCPLPVTTNTLKELDNSYVKITTNGLGTYKYSTSLISNAETHLASTSVLLLGIQARGGDGGEYSTGIVGIGWNSTGGGGGGGSFAYFAIRLTSVHESVTITHGVNTTLTYKNLTGTSTWVIKGGGKGGNAGGSGGSSGGKTEYTLLDGTTGTVESAKLITTGGLTHIQTIRGGSGGRGGKNNNKYVANETPGTGWSVDASFTIKTFCSAKRQQMSSGTIEDKRTTESAVSGGGGGASYMGSGGNSYINGGKSGTGYGAGGGGEGGDGGGFGAGGAARLYIWSHTTQGG
jgi:hypothetical protein